MRVVLVYNPRSGSSQTLDELKKHFTEAGISVIESIPVSSDLEKNLATYVKQTDVIIAGYGGDGTLSSIAAVLTGKKTVFAPLAGGTLNHFTKDLGIPQELDDALAQLEKSKPRPVDVACVNGRTFLNNSSIGLYPSILQMRDEVTRKRTFKWPAAIIASVKAFVRYRCYEVAVNGERFTTPFVFVGNNDYDLENRLIGDRKTLDRDVLSVYSIVAADRFSLLRVLARSLVGKFESRDEIKIWKTDNVTIETKRTRLRISRDGEHETIESPLTYTLIHGGLLVIGGK